MTKLWLAWFSPGLVNAPMHSPGILSFVVAAVAISLSEGLRS
jgi:hypothetical protein